MSTQAVGDAVNARLGTGSEDGRHHLVCRGCGRTEDTDCALGADPCLLPATTSGYVVDEAEVVFWGRCPECRAKARKT